MAAAGGSAGGVRCTFSGPHPKRFLRGHVDGIHREFDSYLTAAQFCVAKGASCSGITRSAFGKRLYEPRAQRKLEPSPPGSEIEESWQKVCPGDDNLPAMLRKMEAEAAEFVAG